MAAGPGVDVAPSELEVLGADPPNDPALLGMVVRPLPREVVAREVDRAFDLDGLAGAASLAIGIVAAAPPTVRLLTTVFTPVTAAASLAAAIRSVSLATVPLSVT